MSAPSSDTRGPLLALAAMGSLTLALGVVWLAVDVGAPDVGQSRPGIGDNPWVPRASGRSIGAGRLASLLKSRRSGWGLAAGPDPRVARSWPMARS